PEIADATSKTQRSKSSSYATRSHPHPSPSQTGSRAASSPPRAGRNFLALAEMRKSLRPQLSLCMRLQVIARPSRVRQPNTRLRLLSLTVSGYTTRPITRVRTDDDQPGAYDARFPQFAPTYWASR